jgi:hypothetical protein
MGWNISLDLDEDAEEDAALRVLHFREQLDTVSRKITTAANTCRSKRLSATSAARNVSPQP